MSCVSKLSQKMLEALDNVDLDDLTQSSNPSSDSESSYTNSGSSSDGSNDDSPNSAAKLCNHDSNTDKHTPKCHKVESAITRVKKTRGPGKKNERTSRCCSWLTRYGLNVLYMTVLSDAPKWKITYHLSIFSSKQMGKPKKNWGNPKSDFLWLDLMKNGILSKLKLWWRLMWFWSLQPSAMMNTTFHFLFHITHLSWCYWIVPRSMVIW